MVSTKSTEFWTYDVFISIIGDSIGSFDKL